MPKRASAFFAIVSLVLVSAVPYPSTSLAHEPGWTPGPRLASEIKPGDQQISLEPVVSGMTAPNRGTVAPGDSTR